MRMPLLTLLGLVSLAVMAAAGPPFLQIVAALITGYTMFAAWLLGLHQRLPLALGPISLDRIPDRAARAYGDRVLCTSDRPCVWDVPALHAQYPHRAVRPRYLP